MLISSTRSAAIKKHTITQNLRCKLPEIAPGTTVRIWTDEQNLWDKKNIVVSQNNHPWSYNILNERGNILARNHCHLIPTAEKFSIKHDSDNSIPVSNTSTHPNLMIDNQHEKPTLKDVYRTKSGHIVKKPKWYIDEMWCDLFLTSGHIINKPKQYVNEIMWDDLFEKVIYWRSVIWYDFNNFFVLETIST